MNPHIWERTLMVICRNCHSSLPDECRFCGICGYQMYNNPYPQKPSQYFPPNQLPPNCPPQQPYPNQMPPQYTPMQLPSMLPLQRPPQKKWYLGDQSIVLMLLVFFPVGLFLMWRYCRWPYLDKWIVTGLFVFLIIAKGLVHGQ